MTKYNNAFLLAGYTACGKSTALDVARGFGNVFCFEISTFVRELYHGQNDDEINDNDLGTWASSRKNKHGNGYFAERLVSNIEASVPRTKSVAVSGIRSPEEVKAFIESGLFDNVTVIGVVANENVRWERYSERESSSRKEFNERNKREEDWGVDTVLKYSDVHLTNEWATEERFRNKVKKIIESLMENPTQSWVC